MAIEPLSDAQKSMGYRPDTYDFQDRTFMGGIALATRSSLFVLLAIVVLTGGGFGLYMADKELAKADLALDQATSLSTLATLIERDVWRIRAEQREQSNGSSDATRAAAQQHLILTNRLGQQLDDLYQQPVAADIGEHVSTLREAIAQYGEQYQKFLQKEPPPGPDLIGLEANVRRTMRDIGKTLTTVTSLSIKEAMVAIRAATTEFVESGSSRDLVVIEGQQKGFSRLLTSIPLPKETGNALRLGLDEYSTALTAYARIRLVASNSRGRLDEIISYMAPSINAIIGYAGDNFAEAQRNRKSLRQRIRTMIAAGVAGSIMVMLLFGLFMQRSIAGPISVAARAARRLSDGNTDIVLEGLGNEDETGDIARAFWTLKESIAQARELGENMEKARVEGERGRAAAAEAEWLQRDLISMKAEADKGREALAEVALLRKVIDATADNISQNQQNQNNKAESVAPATAPENPAAQSLDSISSISRLVAQSSQNVTAAADEAERTGTLIRNLSEAAGKIDAVENLIAVIGEQSDMLVVNASPQNPDTNLVVMGGRENSGGPANPEHIARRFDAIRSAAGQASWAVRDVGSLVRDSRKVALDIARLSSTEALTVTNDLLQQSENLRGMLDTLVNKMQTQLTDTPQDEADLLP